MSNFTLNDLREIMRTSVGVDEGVDLDGPIDEVEFTELGYDSLALAEVCSQINRRVGVAIPDDDLLALITPAAIVRSVNDLLVGTAG